jgi:hypothetical protein
MSLVEGEKLSHEATRHRMGKRARNVRGVG